MIKSKIRIPTSAHGDMHSTEGFLQKVIIHDAPLTVGLVLIDGHLLRIDDSGVRNKKPVVKEVSYSISDNVYFVLTTEIEIQEKFLNEDDWKWIPKDQSTDGI